MAASSQNGFKKVFIRGRAVPHLEERNGVYYYRHKVKMLDEQGKPKLKDKRDRLEAKTPTEAAEIIENLRPQKRNANNALPNITLGKHWDEVRAAAARRHRRTEGQTG